MKRYEGDVPCPGCGKSGKEISRDSRDSLCYECGRLLRLGRNKDVELKVEYKRVYQHYYAYHNDRVNSLLHNILAIVDNPNATYKEYGSIKQTFGSNGNRYTIDKRLFDLFQQFFDELDKYCSDLKEAYGKLDMEAKNALQEHRDRIFNEGVERGKELLKQLNRGEITLDSLNPIKQ